MFHDWHDDDDSGRGMRNEMGTSIISEYSDLGVPYGCWMETDK